MLYEVDLKRGTLREIISRSFLKELEKEVLPRIERNAARLRGEHKLSKETRKFLVRPDRIYQISRAALAASGRYVVTSCDGDAVRIWDVTTGECDWNLPTPAVSSFSESEVTCLNVAADGQAVVFVTHDGTVHFWRFSENVETVMKNTKYFSLVEHAISSNGKLVAYGGSGAPESCGILPLKNSYDVSMNLQVATILWCIRLV